MTNVIGAEAYSLAAYSDLIFGLRARRYEFRGYFDAEPHARHVILRHDVDFSLPAALKIAELEADLGVASTYFVLLRTEFYNPMSAEGFAALSRIVQYGHVIGLHFDAALYMQDQKAMNDSVMRESGLLADVIGCPVTVMSFHRPAPGHVGSADVIGGRVNAYAPRFVQSMGYCSDSRGAWHHGHPFDHVSIREGRALHLLTHPFWWQDPPLPADVRLKRFLVDRAQFLDRELARHCAVHQANGNP